MINFESTADKDEKTMMKINSNAMVYSHVHLIYHSVKNLKFYLENPNSDTNNNNNKLQREMEFERNDRLKYSILNDISDLIGYLNNSDFIPEYHLTLTKHPRIKKEKEDTLLR